MGFNVVVVASLVCFCDCLGTVRDSWDWVCEGGMVDGLPVPNVENLLSFERVELLFTG